MALERLYSILEGTGIEPIIVSCRKEQNLLIGSNVAVID